jgi:hypothetical protein
VTHWLFNQRLSLSAQRCSDWPDGFRLYFHENGGRRANECLDVNLNVGRYALSVTLWQIGGWSRILRLIPDRRTAWGCCEGFRFGFCPTADRT